MTYMKRIENILTKLYGRTTDPLRDCSLYKNEGCSHVDGFLCEVSSCEMLKEYNLPLFKLSINVC